MRLRPTPRILLLIAAAAAGIAADATDIVLTPPAGGGVSVTNSSGTITRLRVSDEGATLDGNLILPAASSASAGTIFKGGSAFIHNYGTDNTFIGVAAGNFSMTGSYNAAFGRGALSSNGTGNFNTAAGQQALLVNTTGELNTATGTNALAGNLGGNRNTATGWAALETIAGGSNNTAIGAQALRYLATGEQNIALGNEAGTQVSAGSNNIHIGNIGVAGDSQTTRLGGIQTKVFIAGIAGATSSGGTAVYINGSGQLGTLPSSHRFKDDIADMGGASSALMKLRPVTFHYKTDRDPSEPTLQYGLVAEEVAEVYPGLIARSTDGVIETVMYQHLPPMLLNEYQKQQRAVEAQAKHIAALERDRERQLAKLERLAAEVSSLRAAVAHIEAFRQDVARMYRLSVGDATGYTMAR